MKCKYCGDNINLTMFDALDDVCWGCMEDEGKDIVLSKNIKQKQTKNKKIKKMRNGTN